MAADAGPGATGLLGRHAECAALDQLVADVLAGQSRVLVLRGEAGVGKTALLGYLAGRAAGWQVARAVGVESEMELAYAGLHQLCGPLLDRLERLPAPQRDALATVFGLRGGPAPDRFLVGLATLTLVAEAAEQEPLVCVVEDAQWLDQASAQLLGFVARRLLAERIALVAAARPGSGDDVLAGLPELPIGGLGDSDARALLLGNVPGPLDAAVCDQLVSESHGNPLALLELPRTWDAAALAGGFGLPGRQPVVGKIDRSYVRRLRLLRADTQLLVLTAAAEPLGDPVLLHRATEILGVDMAAVSAAVDAGLLQVGGRVEFAHPLVRSAAYRSAAAEDRHRVHRALAEATDAVADPDRRAWHLAQATPGPGEEVAAELERSAGRAQARGGLAAMAAFLERAAALTPAPAQQAERALAAAAAKVQAGAFDAALLLLAMAEAGPLDEFQRARVDLLRAQLALVAHQGTDVPPLLVKAAKRLQPIDLDLARATYLDAMSAAMFAGRLAGPGASAQEVARAAGAAPRPAHPPRAPDLLLDGLAAHFTEGYAAGLPILRQALSAFGSELSAEEGFHWLWPACIVALHLWDDNSWDLLSNRYVGLAREAGALGELPLALSLRVFMLFFAGELASAGSLVEEVQAAIDATGNNLPPFGALGLAALQGREAETSRHATAMTEGATRRGEGIGIGVAAWASAVLGNGLGHYDQALAAAEQASAYPADLGTANWGLVELIEAAARTGSPERAADALRRLSEATSASGSDWALGVEARSRALVSDGDSAERWHRAAIERLRRSRMRAELARAHLLYGEWLRREHRRVDAREQLSTAHELLTAIGMEGFAERARRELLATGERVRERNVETRDELTAQEALIARLAREGLSNPEIGARLFLSARTVEWHLRKVFTKLGISSRRQLRVALPEGGRGLAS